MPGYGLPAPTALDGLTRLAHVVGGVQALQLWSEVTRSLGLHGMDLGPRELQQIAGALVERGGPCGVVARAWDVRIRSYQTLSARTARPGGRS